MTTATPTHQQVEVGHRRLVVQVSTDYVFSHLGYFTVMPVLPILLAAQFADHGAQWVGIALFTLAAAVRGGSLVVSRAIHRTPVRRTVVLGLLLAAAGFGLSGRFESPAPVLAALAVAGLGISVNALAMRAYVAVATDDVARRNGVYSAIQIAVNISASVGPVLANLLLATHRSTVLLVVSACYVVAAGSMALMIPAGVRLDRGAQRPAPILRLFAALGSDAFRSIAVAVVGGSFLYAQFFSAFALFINLASEDSLVRAGCFTLNAVLVVALQVPVSRWIGARLAAGEPPLRWLLVGVVGFGCSFAIVALGGTTVWSAYLSIAVLSAAETVFTPLVSTAFMEAGAGRPPIEVLNLRQIASTIGESSGAFVGGAVFLVAVRADHDALFWWALALVAALTVALTAMTARTGRSGR